MNIQHNPKLDAQKVAQHYSEKDGVTVKYICTSAISKSGASSADIFFRETPHPEFGNRYFGLYANQEGNLMITNADNIENLQFEMIEVDGVMHYSQHRHDFRGIGHGIAIDGGREYYRSAFSDRDYYISCPRMTLKVKDGEFVNVQD